MNEVGIGDGEPGRPEAFIEPGGTRRWLYALAESLVALGVDRVLRDSHHRPRSSLAEPDRD